MTAYFVTATGTNIGKTYIAAGIIRAMREAGHLASAIKPVISGYDPGNIASSDPGVLLEAMGKPVTTENIAAISPWRYAAPLSPDMAAARENRQVDLNAIVTFCETAIATANGMMLIEGVGGAMAPLNHAHTVRSLVTALGLPAVLVAGTYLGTISHTLATAEALIARGIKLTAVVLNESLDSPVPPEETAGTLRRFLSFTPVKIIPRNFNNISFQDLMNHLMIEGRKF